MKLTQKHIDQVRTAFKEMQSKEDFLLLLNFAKPFVFGKKAIPFELKQLTWYSNPNLKGKRYKEFKIKKKSGEDRSIHAPVQGLRSLQKTLAFILQCIVEPHKAAMGFVRKRSIVDNARIHEGNRYVFNLDLKDFFSSIDQARVWACLKLKPLNLNQEFSVKPKYWEWKGFNEKNVLTEVFEGRSNEKERYFLDSAYGPIYLARNFDSSAEKYVLYERDIFSSNSRPILRLVNHLPCTNRLNIANIIAGLCCTEMEVERLNDRGEWENQMRNVLPQGAPTSPIVTNIVCQRLDFILSGLAKRFGLKYSRYADDITFSSMINVYKPRGEFKQELRRIIADQGFQINERKTRLQMDGQRKEVTGLIVNEKANVSKQFIKQLRQWLYLWERYGYKKSAQIFLPQYLAEQSQVLEEIPEMSKIIRGKIHFLRMVKGVESEMYAKLQARFDALIEQNSEKQIGITSLGTIVKPKNQPKVIAPQMKSTNGKKIQESPRRDGEISIPIVHKPKELCKYLRKFSENESSLKYTTHSWDAGRDSGMFKDLSGFLASVANQYKKFSFELKKLSEHLNGKIYSFLLNPEVCENGWGEHRIKFGWSSPELLQACTQNPRLNPEDFVLPQDYQLQVGRKTVQKFKHAIDIFKNEIEIRDETPTLYNLILEKHGKILSEFDDPVISNLRNKTFYTDVQWLNKALDIILKSIESRGTSHKEVRYSILEPSEEAYVFEILHVESMNDEKSVNAEKLKLNTGDFGDLHKYLNNLCDWSIESQFAEGCVRINYLVSEEGKPSHERIEKAEGFKHILTFYK